MTTTTAPRPPGSARQLFARTILVCEMFVVAFAGLVAFGLRVAPVGAILAVAGWLVLVCAAGAGTLKRGGVGYAVGWVAQVLLVLTGVALVVAEPFVGGIMIVLAVIFAVLWAASDRVGRRIDVEREERYQAELELYRRHHPEG